MGSQNAAGVISMPVGTTQQFLFPLVYSQPEQGSFAPVLTGADFFVGKKPSTPEAKAVLHRALNSGVTETEIDGVRHLVVSLAPADTEGIAAASYRYAAVIEWGANDRAVIARDSCVLTSWPGHSMTP